MSNATMKAYKVESIDFAGKIEGKQRLDLQNKYSYNVRYSPQNICRGEFTVEVSDKTVPDKFHFKAVVIGVFSFKPGVEKELLHVETYNQLFPYVRSLVTTVTANCGIPPVMIPFTDLEGQNIYRFEKNPGGNT
ncbi:MAG: protein-export chaperone SecB [Clostridia bacterium]|nr:protein-export chaperone SecB [Clostridia bacterium]